MSTSLQCVLRSDVARLYRRISKRLAVETTSLYCSCFITPSHHSCSLAWPDPRRKREGLATPDYRSCSSLLKSTHAISIDFAEMHANHIVISGSPHNNVLHFSSNIIVLCTTCALQAAKSGKEAWIMVSRTLQLHVNRKSVFGNRCLISLPVLRCSTHGSAEPYNTMQLTTSELVPPKFWCSVIPSPRRGRVELTLSLSISSYRLLLY